MPNNIDVIRDGSEVPHPTQPIPIAKCGRCGKEIKGNNVFVDVGHDCVPLRMLPPPKQIVIRFLPRQPEGAYLANAPNNYYEGVGEFDVEMNGESTGGLSFGELIEQIISLTHPKLDGKPRFPMMTREDWAKYYDRVRG